jgi:dTDP-4-dehydrorhamnose reductase
MAVILVTGAYGQLGNEIKVLSKNYSGYEFIFTDVDTLDISDKTRVNDFVEKNRPDWIINCAAYNFVDKAESEADKAFQINSVSVRNLAESIKGTDRRLIHVSTDYVFDGDSNVPYNEYSIPNPSSVYAKSKRAGEESALTHAASMIIRTSWLYSSFGNNFVKTIIKHGTEKESLKVVFDQIGTPTYAADLANAIMLIVSKVIRNQIAFNAGIYHYSNEGVCSWYDFAYEIIQLSGLGCKVLPILSKEFTSIVKRPFYSVLDKSKIKEYYDLDIPYWKESLKKCIKLLR